MATEALRISKTGLEAQQTRMAVISNNLANVTQRVSKSLAPFLKIYFTKISGK